MADKTFYPEGLYQVRITGQEFGENDNGTMCLALKFVVLAEHAGGDICDFKPADQKERVLRRYLTDKTVNFFIDDLKYFGANIASFKLLDPAVPGFHSFVGLGTDLWCKHEKYKDDTVERWQVPMGESTPMKKVDPAKLRALDNQFGAALRGAFGAVQNKPAQQPVAAGKYADGVDDDSIPF